MVFQTSRSAQSKAIQTATASPYSHVGVIEVGRNGVFVIEASAKVARTGWDAWRRRGEEGKVTVMRPVGIDAGARRKAVDSARGFLGLPYDGQFRWGDGAMYCSELVYKAYARGAGVALGKLQRLDELDLEPVREAMTARFGSRLPLDRELVTPASIAADPKLVTVCSDFAGPGADAPPACR